MKGWPIVVVLGIAAAGCVTDRGPDPDVAYGPYDDGAYYDQPRVFDYDVEQRATYSRDPYYASPYPYYYGGYRRYPYYRGDHDFRHGDHDHDDGPNRERSRSSTASQRDTAGGPRGGGAHATPGRSGNAGRGGGHGSGGHGGGR